MAKRRTFIDRLPLAPIFALLFGTAVAIVIGAMPDWRFEQLIGWTGLGSVLSVAQPPLGLKARLLAVMLGFAIVAICVWLSVTAVQRLLEGPKPPRENDVDDELDLGEYAAGSSAFDTPRRPIFADRELGAPFMSDEALARVGPLVTALLDLDDELTAESVHDIPEAELVADPDPVLNVTQDPVATVFEPVAPPKPVDPILEAPLDVAEFDLPPAAYEPEPVFGESTIDTLIRRLEAGMARRAGPPPPNAPQPNPPASAANPLGAMRDLMARNRDEDADNDIGTARALDTLQRLAARRKAG